MNAYRIRFWGDPNDPSMIFVAVPERVIRAVGFDPYIEGRRMDLRISWVDGKPAILIQPAVVDIVESAKGDGEAGS